MANHGKSRPLRVMVEAFENLQADFSNGGKTRIALGPFSRACSLMYPLFNAFPPQFNFVEIDYRAKVDDLLKASERIPTLSDMIVGDIEAKHVEKIGSHTRNLLRVKRSLQFVKIMFEQVHPIEVNSIQNSVINAYTQAFLPHHLWTVRKDVEGIMRGLPTKDQLLTVLHEDRNSASILLQSYVESVAPIITYIDELFISRGLGIDW